MADNNHKEALGEKTKLVGYRNFKRHNPMSDRFEVSPTRDQVGVILPSI